MTRLEWGAVGDRLYETGIDRGVLYVDGYDGVPWNGLTAVAEAISGGDVTSYFLDGNMYLNVSSPEVFKATISALYSPKEFDECDGVESLDLGFYATNQPRKTFGLSYRTMLGNDVSSEYGYKIHLVYNALASVSNHSYSTINNDPAAGNLSWGITTKPVTVPGMAPSAHFIIDSTTTFPWIITAIEAILYGDSTHAPRLPTITELIAVFHTATSLVITDNGDGTWTATGPDAMITMLDGTTFQIVSNSAVIIDSTSYTISSI